MKFKNYLRTGIITATLVLGASSLQAKGLENVVNQTKQTQQVQENTEKKKLSTSQLIKAATLENSFKFVEICKMNTPFKQQIKKHGLKKTVEHLAEMKSYSINLANKYSKDPNEIPEKVYLIASKEIGTNDLNFHKGHTKPLDKKVIKARAIILKIATKGHKKILSGTKPSTSYENKNISEQYSNLIKENFTKEEYTKYCEQMADSMDEYYNALADSLGWKKGFGKKDINKMKKVSRAGYFSTLENVYSKKK